MTPETESELCDIIRDATGPLVITGGGTRGFTDGIDGTALSTRALSGIELYEPGALTIVARAGTPVAEIEAALDAENQMLAFEPMDHRALLGTTDSTAAPTIGGVVAANISGPRRVQVGACRDFLLGVRFVDGNGTLIKNGGRVMKNVTGYDLSKLMCGSMGTLGVLTEVALKVLPRPEATATLTLENLSLAQAIAAMSMAMATPYGVSGAGCGPVTGTGTGTTRLHLRVEGMTASVAYRAEQLQTRLQTFGPADIETDADSCRALWASLRDVAHMANTPFVARTSIKPSQAQGFVETVSNNLPGTHYLDWAGGLIWTGADDTAGAMPASDNSAQSRLATLRDAMAMADGHTTLIKADHTADTALQRFAPQPAVLAQLSQQLRAKFDPRDILNQGMMM